jgi:hypothetical protein
MPANSTCTITVYVSVAKAGTYVNKLATGVLKTNLGNNASGYNASLIVSTSAGSGTQLAKSFSPSTIGSASNTCGGVVKATKGSSTGDSQRRHKPGKRLLQDDR